MHGTSIKTKTNIRALSGIRTHDPGHIAASDLRIRPHGRGGWAEVVVACSKS